MNTEKNTIEHDTCLSLSLADSVSIHPYVAVKIVAQPIDTSIQRFKEMIEFRILDSTLIGSV